MKTAMMNYLTAAISDAQHCFVPRRSCFTNIRLTEQWVIELMDGGETVGMVSLDFTEAFDTVNHRMSCTKLGAYEFNSMVVDCV